MNACPLSGALRPRAAANDIACALHAWWCAQLGRPMSAQHG
ncbi:hypothetical protein [Deinococcus betulae]|nr:hypothetical protein [Deinococcus betulae]